MRLRPYDRILPAGRWVAYPDGLRPLDEVSLRDLADHGMLHALAPEQISEQRSQHEERAQTDEHAA
jgi:hypothetical protein